MRLQCSCAPRPSDSSIWRPENMQVARCNHMLPPTITIWVHRSARAERADRLKSDPQKILTATWLVLRCDWVRGCPCAANAARRAAIMRWQGRIGGLPCFAAGDRHPHPTVLQHRALRNPERRTPNIPQKRPCHGCNFLQLVRISPSSNSLVQQSSQRHSCGEADSRGVIIHASAPLPAATACHNAKPSNSSVPLNLLR